MQIGRLCPHGYVFTEVPFDNVVYEYHTYVPSAYVSQSAYTTDNLTYPQDSVAVMPDNPQINYVDGLWDAGQYNNSSSNTWQTIQNNTPEAVPTTGNINNGYVQIYLKNLASNTTVTIDEIKVSEYDKSNNFIRDVYFDDFSDDSNYIFVDGSNSDSTRVQNSTNGGYSGDASKIIQGVTGSNAAIFSNDYYKRFFVVNPDNKYQVSIRVKVQNPGPNTSVVPAIIYSYCEGQAAFNKSCIEAAVQPYIDYSNQKNVPIFMGEYGIGQWCFKQIENVSDGTLYTDLGNLGGEQWIDDMLSVITDKGLNSGYWCYSSPRVDIWGLYVGDINNYKIYINEYIENAFARYFGESAATGFFHTSGKDIIDPAGETYTIKSIAIENDVSDINSLLAGQPGGVDYALIATTESDYQKLKTLGFNSVRFLLSYKFFDDSKGFQLLDQNIAWAKKYGISLILNMHVPNGGYQSDGGGSALWTDMSNQDNLVALWTNIATRYKDEPTIMGYGIVNEPGPVRLSTETSEQALDKWKNLASRIATGVRSVDNNHILFVENATCTRDMYGNWEATPSRLYVYRNSF